MRDSYLMGFTERYFKVYRLHGYAKSLKVDQALIQRWLGAFVSSSWMRNGAQNMSSSFCCQNFEFQAQENIVFDPTKTECLTSRWHIYSHVSMLMSDKSLDAYIGNLHVDWQSIHGVSHVKNIELCVLRKHEVELAESVRKDLVKIKLAT